MAAIAPAGIITHLNDYLSSTAKRAAAVEAQGRAAGRSTGAIGVGGRNHAATLWPRPLPRTFAPACKIPRFLGAYLSHNARPRASNSPPPEYRKPPRNGRTHAGKATAAPGWNHTHLNDYLSSTAKRAAAVEAQGRAAGTNSTAISCSCSLFMYICRHGRYKENGNAPRLYRRTIGKISGSRRKWEATKQTRNIR